jgi:hypothetical protein
MLTFDALTHTYQWCGKPVPSVTQAIGEWIPVNIYGTEYYVNAFTGLTFPAEKFRVAADWGTAVHAMNRLHLEGSLDRDSLHPDLLPVLGAFDDWLIAHKPKIILVETPMYSMRHGYAGTPDLRCEIRRRLWVIGLQSGGIWHGRPADGGIRQAQERVNAVQTWRPALPQEPARGPQVYRVNKTRGIGAFFNPASINTNTLERVGGKAMTKTKAHTKNEVPANLHKVFDRLKLELELAGFGPVLLVTRGPGGVNMIGELHEIDLSGLVFSIYQDFPIVNALVKYMMDVAVFPDTPMPPVLREYLNAINGENAKKGE